MLTQRGSLFAIMYTAVAIYASISPASISYFSISASFQMSNSFSSFILLRVEFSMSSLWAFTTFLTSFSNCSSLRFLYLSSFRSASLAVCSAFFALGNSFVDPFAEGLARRGHDLISEAEGPKLALMERHPCGIGKMEIDIDEFQIRSAFHRYAQPFVALVPAYALGALEHGDLADFAVKTKLHVEFFPYAIDVR